VLRKIDEANNEGPKLGLLECQWLEVWLAHEDREIAAAGA
jgi:hypothetical protein